jgi:hypothetical protein
MAVVAGNTQRIRREWQQSKGFYHVKAMARVKSHQRSMTSALFSDV